VIFALWTRILIHIKAPKQKSEEKQTKNENPVMEERSKQKKSSAARSYASLSEIRQAEARRGKKGKAACR
jgi:hypothetical protein